jgi:hypothetical protein
MAQDVRVAGVLCQTAAGWAKPKCQPMFFALECAPEFKHIVKFDRQSLFMAAIQEAALTPLCTSEIRRAVLESKSTAKVTVCVSDHNLIGKL